MSLDVVIGMVGVIVTILTVVGMILITPRGVGTSHSQRSRPASTTPDLRRRRRQRPARTALSTTTNAAIGCGPANVGRVARALEVLRTAWGPLARVLAVVLRRFGHTERAGAT